MNIQSPALIRETFPVGPLQCNCTNEQRRKWLNQIINLFF